MTAADLSWKGWLTMGLIIVMLVAMVKEVRPPDIVMTITAGLLAIFGCIDTRQLLQGFSSDVILTLAMLCIVVKALEVNGVLELFSRRVLPKTKNYAKQLGMLLFPVSALSAFLNNTVIVLMMTPSIRKWAIDKDLSPSKYLIPLSYASIVGGLCTLIGTSTNVIVDGLLRQQYPEAGLQFFELAKVGVPITFCVIGFIITVGNFLLPVRRDVSTAISEQTQEFTGEFIVTEEFSHLNKPIKELSGKLFRGELLIEIERDSRVIRSPGPDEQILEGDRLIFAGDIQQIAELHTIQGFVSPANPHFEVDSSSAYFSEVVVAATSSLIGKTLKSVNFRHSYGASALAVYRQGRRVRGNVGDIILDSGDTLILFSSETWEADYFGRDFYTIRVKEKLPIFNPFRASLVVAIAVGMVVMAGMGVPIVIAVMASALMYIFTRSVTFREVGNSIIWNVLLLIASSFAVANAVKETGVAAYLAGILLSIFGTDPRMIIGGILVVSTMFTEILSNNAAALLLFPIALQTAQIAGFESIQAVKTIGVTIAVGCSCGFSLPTGYQTHMIVYGPGGYRLTDFIRIGILIDVIIIAIASVLIPMIWPLI